MTHSSLSSLAALFSSRPSMTEQKFCAQSDMADHWESLDFSSSKSINNDKQLKLTYVPGSLLRIL